MSQAILGLVFAISALSFSMIRSPILTIPVLAPANPKRLVLLLSAVAWLAMMSGSARDLFEVTICDLKPGDLS